MSEHELEGCCDGRLCLLEERTGKRVCRDGSRDERALYGECTSTLEAGLDSDLSLATPTIETSQGTFTFDRVESAVGTLGEGGCLTRLDVTVAGPGEYCWMSLGVMPDGSRLTVDRFETGGRRVPRLHGPGQLLPRSRRHSVRPHVRGLTCEESASGKGCYTGAFTFHLDGAIQDDEYSMVFEQQTLVLTGTICGQPFGNGCLWSRCRAHARSASSGDARRTEGGEEASDHAHERACDERPDQHGRVRIEGERDLLPGREVHHRDFDEGHPERGDEADETAPDREQRGLDQEGEQDREA